MWKDLEQFVGHVGLQLWVPLNSLTHKHQHIFSSSLIAVGQELKQLKGGRPW